MSLESIIIARVEQLSALSGKVYPAEALQGASAPFAFYLLTADSAEAALSGLTELHIAQFEISVVTATYPQLIALAAQVKTKLWALPGAKSGNIEIQQVEVSLASPDLKEMQVNLYRRAYSLRIYYKEELS